MDTGNVTSHVCSPDMDGGSNCSAIGTETGDGHFTEKELTLLRGPQSYFITVGGILVVLIGVVGNSLIVVLKTRGLNCFTADAGYKVTLAVADTCSLCVGMSRHLIYSFTYHDPIDVSLMSCRLIFYFMYSFQYLSTWILVALNVERCVAIASPLAHLRSRTCALTVSSAIVVFFFASQSYFFFTYDVQTDTEGRTRCALRPQAAKAFNVAFPWITMFVNCILPMFVFIGTHVVILKKLKTRENTIGQSVVRVTGGPEASGRVERCPSTLTPHQSGPSRWSSMTSDQSNTSLASENTRKSYITRGNEASTLRFLLLMDVSFFVLVFPRELFIVISYSSGLQLKDQRDVAWRLRFAMLSVFAYMNNSLNFLYYCVLSAKFRAEAWSLLRGTTCPSPCHATRGARRDVPNIVVMSETSMVPPVLRTTNVDEVKQDKVEKLREVAETERTTNKEEGDMKKSDVIPTGATSRKLLEKLARMTKEDKSVRQENEDMKKSDVIPTSATSRTLLENLARETKEDKSVRQENEDMKKSDVIPTGTTSRTLLENLARETKEDKSERQENKEEITDKMSMTMSEENTADHYQMKERTMVLPFEKQKIDRSKKRGRTKRNDA